MLTDALTPSHTAVRMTEPGFRVTTHPPAATIASATSLTVQLTLRPFSGPAHRSSGVAVSANESPATTDWGTPEMCTAATFWDTTVRVISSLA
jgi:hypothetical protein